MSHLETLARYWIDCGHTYCLAIRDGAHGPPVVQWPCMAREGIPGVPREEFALYQKQARWVCDRLNRLDYLEPPS